MELLSSIDNSNVDIQAFFSAKQYKQALLDLIIRAKRRIYITALYLQDDEAGREVLHALYKAKSINPKLEVKVFVDFHRAQRGLIGEKGSLGNRSLYLKLAEQYTNTIDIYGVPVKSKELLGVLHLKGMVFDDAVFYTGASINNIYLHQDEKYRLDRYYLINAKPLANSFCDYLDFSFIESDLCPLLNRGEITTYSKQNVAKLKSLIKRSSYRLSQCKTRQNVIIKPLVACGPLRNGLNRKIRRMIQKSQSSLLIFTPYFNLPKPLKKDIINALKRGVKITLVIGDKTANDFYIPEEKNFTTIGIVPYLYEMLLLRFVKRWQKFIDVDLLTVRLWKHESNSFHLKGIVSDERYHLLTGNNLNPRAWSLDLENGLFLDDENKTLMLDLKKETELIFEHTQILNHYSELDQIADYAKKPKKLIKKIRLTQIHRLLKKFL
ncbi:CDP-diacylglycerol--serine O-phosphatidyltransferase [Colwellia sp. RE-S-Sl-9]